MMTRYEMFVKAFEDGKIIQIRKYRYNGQWSDWKAVSDIKTLGKCKVSVDIVDEFDEEVSYCPYDFRIA